MPSKGFIVCLQLKVLSVGTNSVILRRPDPIYTTAFGYPYCSQLCCERFWIVICLLTQRQWQVKVRQDGQNHMQKIEHVLITCVYSKVLSSKKCKIPDPQLTCILSILWLSLADVTASAISLSVLCVMLYVMLQGSSAGARKCCDKSATLPVQARWGSHFHDGPRRRRPASASHAGMQKLFSTPICLF